MSHLGRRERGLKTKPTKRKKKREICGGANKEAASLGKRKREKHEFLIHFSLDRRSKKEELKKFGLAITWLSI